MASVLSLAIKINADASGLKLDPVERALKQLGAETEKVSGIFDKFTATSEAAARAQADTSKALQDLIAARRAGTMSAQEFAQAFETIRDAANAEASALQRAAQITEANLQPLERYDRALTELNEQLQSGRVSQETYNRATEGAAKGLTDAERAARGLAAQQKAIDASASNTTLKFNELSGVFAALPGPLGNIAGRISGLSSAGEGLGRVFAGGVRSGISNVAGSLTALVYPLTIAVAGVAGFAAAAGNIVRGLVDLEARVKGLGAAADQLGVSFETIQVLEEAASRAGTSLDSATAGIQKFAVRINDARSGTGAAAEAFRELGIAQADLATTAPTELAGRVAEALSRIEDPARRAALQVDLLGKSGEELRRFFSEIPDATTDLEKFGAAISDDDRARVEALGPAFDEFGVALRGLGQSVLTPFAGIVTGVTKTLSGVINVVTSVAQAFGSVLGPVLNEFGSLFGGIGDGINFVVSSFRGFFTSTEEATQKVSQLKKVASEATKFDTKPARDYERAVEGIRVNLTQAFKESREFGDAGTLAARRYAITVAQINGQLNQRLISEEDYKRAIERASESYESQIGVIRRVAQEAERKAQAEQDAVQRIIDSNQEAIRVQQQFGGDSGRADAAENLLRINDEFERVELQIRDARRAGDQETVDALTSRLAVLDQVAARESDIATGAAAQRQADADAAAQREQAEQQLRERRLQADKEVERQVAAERQRVNQFIDQNIALQQVGGDQSRLTAAQNLAALEQEILRITQEVARAKAAGDAAAVAAGNERIAAVNEIANKERDIANGKAAEREAERRQLEKINQERQKASEEQQKRAEQFAQQQQQEAQKAQEAQQQALEERARQQRAELKRQAAITRQLNSVGQQSVSGSDIRSTEGASTFIRAAAGQFDPVLAQLRVQTKILNTIAIGIAQNLSQLTGTPTQIGAVRV